MPTNEETTTYAAETVYVVVSVSYDYHRFQNNLLATTNIVAARAVAAVAARGYARHGTLPVIEDVVVSSNMNDDETNHILIEVFPKTVKLRDDAPVSASVCASAPGKDE